MQEKTLRLLALVCSLAGIVSLFFISSGIELTAMSISKITIDDIGNTVKICGEITSRRVSKNHIFLDVRDDTGTIRLVIFNSTALGMKGTENDPYELRDGDTICTAGSVDEYPKGSGALEVIYRRGIIEKV